MREQIAKRCDELKAELVAGQKMLAELETRQANLRQTLLRISGAIQVLEEILASAQTDSSSDLQPVAENA